MIRALFTILCLTLAHFGWAQRAAAPIVAQAADPDVRLARRWCVVYLLMLLRLLGILKAGLSTSASLLPNR
jgi:hypothetical protein